MRAPRLSRRLPICAVLTLAPAVSALVTALETSQPASLVQRDANTTCADSSLSRCINVDFCCPTASTCIPLDQGVSVFCCPAGQTCNFVTQIPCDTSHQDASKYPLWPIHSSNLSIPLPKCQSACCPLGFTCQGELCARPTASGTGSSTTAPISTSASTSTSMHTLMATKSNTTPVVIPTFATPTASSISSNSSYNPFPASAILLGFFLGAFLGIILTILAQNLWRRYRRPQNRSGRDSADFMGQTPAMQNRCSKRPSGEQQMDDQRPYLARSTVSDPIVAPTFGAIHRTDFLLRHDSAQASMAESTHSAKPSYSSTRSATLVDTLPLEAYVPPLRMPAMPKTPENPSRSRSGSDRGAPPQFLSPLRPGLPQTPAPPPNGPGQALRSQSRSPARAPNDDRSTVDPLVHDSATSYTPSTLATATPRSTGANTQSPYTAATTTPPSRQAQQPLVPLSHQKSTRSNHSSHASSLIQDDSDSGRRGDSSNGINHGSNVEARDSVSAMTPARPQRTSSRTARTTTSTPSRTREPSTETINVLMPAPDFEESHNTPYPYGTPQGGGLKDYWGHESTQTTLSAMMEGVGAGAGAWRPRTDGRTPPRG